MSIFFSFVPLILGHCDTGTLQHQYTGTHDQWDTGTSKHRDIQTLGQIQIGKKTGKKQEHTIEVTSHHIPACRSQFQVTHKPEALHHQHRDVSYMTDAEIEG